MFRLRYSLSEISLAAVAEVVVCAAVIFCPWASGGVPNWSIVAFLALAFGGAALALGDAISHATGLPWSLGGWALLVFTAVTALQLVPLPPGVLHAVSPASWDLLQFTLLRSDALSAWHPISLDPPATRIALAKQLGYLAIYLTTACVARAGGRRRMMTVIGVLGAAMALSVFLHSLFGLDSLFGIEALHRDNLPSPFVNRNNHAALLELAACIQLGLLLRTDDRRLSFAWGLGFLITGAGIILSGSRGGVVSLVAALLVFFALMTARGTGSGAILRRRLAVAGMLLVGVMSVAAYLNLDAILERMGTVASIERIGANTKVSLWPSMVPLVKEHWQVGVGRDAFGEIYPHYQLADFDNSYAYPENLVLQTTSDFGVPLGLLVLVLFAGAWAYAARRAEPSLAEIGLLAGIFAIGLHDMGDFALELTGVAVPSVAALALLEIRPGSRRWLPALVATAAAIASAAALPWCVGAFQHSAARDQGRVMAAVDRGNPDDVVKATSAALEFHPANYIIELAPAVELMRSHPPRPQEALFWANRAMYLAPRFGWPHLIAGDALFLLGHRQQGLLEYRLAVEDIPNQGVLVLTLRANLKSAQEFADVTAQTSQGFAWAMDVASVNRNLEIDIGQIALKRLNLEDPGILLRMSDALRSVGRGEEALSYARRLLAVEPGEPGATVQVARGLRELGQTEEAEKTLRDGLSRNPHELSLSLELAGLLAHTKRPHQALDVLAGVPDSNREVRQQIIAQEVPLLESVGMVARALSDLRESARLDPASPARHYLVAELLIRNGQSRQALAAIDSGLSIDSGESLQAHRDWKARVQAQALTEDRNRLLEEVRGPPADRER
jgi:tetratricopeptide (TPR) repeat protein